MATPGPRTGGIITYRQAVILRYLSEGWTNPQISRELYLSENTIKGAVHDLAVRLGATNRAHIVAIAFKKGLL